jgi:hypothetical protein
VDAVDGVAHRPVEIGPLQQQEIMSMTELCHHRFMTALSTVGKYPLSKNYSSFDGRLHFVTQ